MPRLRLRRPIPRDEPPVFDDADLPARALLRIRGPYQSGKHGAAHADVAASRQIVVTTHAAFLLDHEGYRHVVDHMAREPKSVLWIVADRPAEGAGRLVDRVRAAVAGAGGGEARWRSRVVAAEAEGLLPPGVAEICLYGVSAGWVGIRSSHRLGPGIDRVLSDGEVRDLRARFAPVAADLFGD